MGTFWSYDKRSKTAYIKYNSELTGLPADTEIINFEYIYTPLSLFNQPVYKDSLPHSLTHLTFGYYFNQQINKGSLPNSITHLVFGHRFIKSVKNLPNSITHLTIKSIDYNQEINKLPENLIFLELSVYYDKPINNLPYGL
jgi:hypothetical protein